jgi:hypothetical protein
MSKRTVAGAPGVELILRDIPDRYTLEGLVGEQYELEVGGWVYDSRYATRSGMEEMIEAIGELQTSLDVIRAALFTAWQEGTAS